MTSFLLTNGMCVYHSCLTCLHHSQRPRLGYHHVPPLRVLCAMWYTSMPTVHCAEGHSIRNRGNLKRMMPPILPCSSPGATSCPGSATQE